MGIPGGEAFGFVVVALCSLADQTVIQAVWSLVVWGRLVPRPCSCELWTCTLSHLLDQWDTPLAAAAVLKVLHCRLHVPFRAFSTTSVPRGEVQSVKTKHLTKAFTKMCIWENLPLHLVERPGFTALTRTMDAKYPQISGRSVTTSVEEQADEVVKSKWCTMFQVYI